MLANKIILFIKSKTENGWWANLLLIIGASASIFWSIYFGRVTISMPYQIEFREGAAQVMTSLLLKGENPFDFEHQPLGLNNYGLGYGAVVLPFAALFGNTLRVHRLVTFIFIFLGALVSFWAVYKARRNISLGLACAAFVMIGLMGKGGTGAAPSGMGSFLFLAIILIPFLRSFDNTGLAWSILFSVIAFYTKAYFVLGFGIVASYLFLFISKKKGIVYALVFIGLAAVTAVAMRLSFPLYFINTIAGNVSNTFRTFENLYSQLIQLFLFFYPVLILTTLLLVMEFVKKKRGSPEAKTTGIIFNFSVWDQPLADKSVNYFLYSLICTFLAFLFILGPHVGNYLNYAYQLLVPTFFFWFFQKLELKKTQGVFLAVLVLFNLFSWQYPLLDPRMLEQGNSIEWKQLYSYLEPSANVLNSSTITSRLIDLGLTPLDSGQTIYYYSVKPYADNPWLGPAYDEFYQDGLEYTEFINDSIRNQKFDLIVTTKDVDIFYDLNLIEEYYTRTKQIVLYMPQTQQKWTVEIWYPPGR